MVGIDIPKHIIKDNNIQHICFIFFRIVISSLFDLQFIRYKRIITQIKQKSLINSLCLINIIDLAVC